MGTGRSGRYSGTRGSRTPAKQRSGWKKGRTVSRSALKHANTGVIGQKLVIIKKGQYYFVPRLRAGGHGEAGRKLLDKKGIQYNIVHTYPNGVRVGNVPDHLHEPKQKGIGQSWFPKNWNGKMIKKAGEHVANLKRNHNMGNGPEHIAYGMYKGVRVGIMKTNGKISTVFPDSDQSKALKSKARKK